jgi:hypothetical protein
MTESPGQQPLLISLHMEKCGGTSLDQLLRQQYGEGFFLYDPGPPDQEHEPNIPSQARCLHGHMFYGLHEQFPGRSVEHITLLREPTERFLSQFEHIRRYQHPLHDEIMKPDGLEQLCQLEEARHYRNLFVRRLSGAWNDVGEAELNLAEQRLRSFAVVGQLSRVDAFVRACARRFDWSHAQLGHANAAPGRHTRFAELGEHERDLLNRANHWDLQLWQRIQDLLVQ